MEALLVGIGGVLLILAIAVGVLLLRCYRELQILRGQVTMMAEDSDGYLEALDRIDRVTRALAETPPPSARS